MKSVDYIGWASSAVLLATIMRQVYTQWKTKSTAGVSRWLFVGQLAASTGYTIYSFLLHNWVFVTSNIALLGTAVLGQALYVSNKRRSERGGTAAGGAAAWPAGPKKSGVI
jgi:MtN3 and saliva related transmembrane protein